MKRLQLAYRIVAAICCLLQLNVSVVAQNFDLGSTEANVQASSLAGSVSIMVNGQIQQVNATTALTPAQLAAVNQVVSAGRQSLLINQQGAATGGSVLITSDLGNAIQDVLIPQNVQGYANFGHAQHFSISGDLVNRGVIYAYSTDPSVNYGFLTAVNIHNDINALLTSVLPTSIATSINAQVSPLSLGLHATDTFTNNGTITISGVFSVYGETAINNISLSPEAPASIHAADFVSLATVNLRNNSVISSDRYITLGSRGDAMFDGRGGTFRSPSFIYVSATGPGENITLIGGSYETPGIEIRSQQGSISGMVDRMPSIVRLDGRNVNFGVSMPKFILDHGSNISASGTIFNSSGSIDIWPDIVASGNLAFIAAGDIYSQRSISTSAGDLTVIAGANITRPAAVNPYDASSVTVNGASLTGGAIEFFSFRDITAPSGDVLLAANSGSGVGSARTPGTIKMPGIQADRLTLIAGATSVPQGQTAINTGTGSLHGNVIKYYLATPEGSVTMSNGSATEGAITAGQLQNISFGTESNPQMLATYVTGSVSVYTAGNVHATTRNNPTNIGDVVFGSQFSLSAPTSTVFVGHIDGSSDQSDVTIHSTGLSRGISFAPTSEITARTTEITSEGFINGQFRSSGSVLLQADGDVDVEGASVQGAFRAASGKNIVLSGEISSASNITLESNGVTEGAVDLAPGVRIQAGRSIAIRNTSENGTITVGTGATIETPGQVAITVGAIALPETGSAPENVAVTESNGGSVYFGNGAVAAAPDSNSVSANQNDVIFNSTSATPGAITLEGAVNISAGAGTPIRVIRSLDLTDPAAVTALVELQQSHPHEVGGNLSVEGGIATGGDLLLASSVDLTSVSGLNVPENVHVVVSGSSADQPLNAFVYVNSHSQQATVEGTLSFAGDTSGSLLVFSQSLLPGLTISGTVQADSAATITADRGLSVTGTVQGPRITLRTLDSNLTINGNVSATEQISLIATGNGDVEHLSGTLFAPGVFISADSGAVRAHSGMLSTVIDLRAPASHVSIGGVLDTGGTMPNSSGGTISVTGATLIVFGDAALSANGAHNAAGGKISLVAKTVEIGGASLSANGAGSGSGGTIEISATDLTAGSVTLAQDASVSATGGAVGSASGNGGSVIMKAETVLTANGHSINVMPLGENGDGGDIVLNAGYRGFFVASSGGMLVSGDLVANGVGTGNGGTVDLSAGSGGIKVSGSIAANTDSGLAGTVKLTTNLARTLAVGSLTGSDYVGGTITVDSAEGLPGKIVIPRVTELRIDSSISAQGASEVIAQGFIEVSPTRLSGNGSLNAALVIQNAHNIQSTLPGTITIERIGGSYPKLTQANGGSIRLQGDIIEPGNSLELRVFGQGSIYQMVGSKVNGGLDASADGDIILDSPLNQISVFNGIAGGNVRVFTNTELWIVSSYSGGSTSLSSPQQVTIAGTLRAESLEVEAPSVVVSSGVTADGDISFQYYGTDREITVTRSGSSNGAIVSTNGVVRFNPLSAGAVNLFVPITSTEGQGVYFNGGTEFPLHIGNVVSPIYATGSEVEIGGGIIAEAISAGDMVISSTTVTNIGTVRAGGSLTINVGYSLVGNGTFDAGNGITINAPQGMSFTGQSLFLTDTTIFGSMASAPFLPITVSPNDNARVEVRGDLTISSLNIINPDGFIVTGTRTFNMKGDGVQGYGTILNPDGDVHLSRKTIVNANGLDVTIIASGNVIADGITLINLSSAKRDGGTLAIFAGVEISPLEHTGQILNNERTYSVGVASSTGGSVLLKGVSINTSSTSLQSESVEGHGGNVHIFATEGSESAGVIRVGKITTTSRNGMGGNVTLVAPGGIIVDGAITTSGADAGGDVIVHIAPGTDGAQITNGVLSSAPAVPTLCSGCSEASININGPINASSKRGEGGNVSIWATSDIETRAITTNALTSGDIQLISLAGSISVLGHMSTSGLNSGLGGVAGTIAVMAQNTIYIGGNVLAVGGTLASGMGGGAGGAITLRTLDADHIGRIEVKGYISSRGGSMMRTNRVNLESGNDITIESGSIRILGSTIYQGKAVSVLSSGMRSSAEIADAGLISITTYATQSVPSNLSLPSTDTTEYALPGGLFTVGTSPVVNGVAKGIMGNSSGIFLNSGFSGTLTEGPISLSADHSKVFDVDMAGTSVTISPAVGTVRTKVTPAVALALYQLSTGATQALQLTAYGALGGTLSSPSEVSIEQSHLPSKFSSFVVSAAAGGEPSAVKINFLGATPVVNTSMAKAFAIQGHLSFEDDSIAWINNGIKPINIPASASIETGLEGLVILTAGGSFTNAGTLSPGVVLSAQDMTVSSDSFIQIGLYPSSTNALVKLDKLHVTSFVSEFRHLSTKFDSLCLAGLPDTKGSVTLEIMGQTQNLLIIDGDFFSGSLTINDKSGDGLDLRLVDGFVSVKNTSVITTGPLTMHGSILSKAGKVTVSGEGLNIFSARLWADTGVVIDGRTSPIQLKSVWLATSTGIVDIHSADAINVGVLIRAGGYANNPVSLYAKDPTKAGGIKITSGRGDVRIGYGSELFSNRGDILVMAKGGDIKLGGNQYGQCCNSRWFATDGNIRILASGDVVNDGFAISGVQLTASGNGGTTTGIIDVAAGYLTPATGVYSYSAGTRPVVNSFIGPLVDNNPNSGVILVDNNSLSMNLANAIVVMSGGALSLRTGVNGQSLNLQRSVLAPSGFQKPVRQLDIQVNLEFVVDVDLDFDEGAEQIVERI